MKRRTLLAHIKKACIRCGGAKTCGMPGGKGVVAASAFLRSSVHKTISLLRGVGKYYTLFEVRGSTDELSDLDRLRKKKKHIVC